LETVVTSKREQVLDALTALVTTALPAATVLRNAAKPQRIPAGGLVVIRDGDLGEAEVLLSPRRYVYNHRIEFEVAALKQGAATREQTLDGMLVAIGNAIQANRTLGGLCVEIWPEAPVNDDIETEGTPAGRSAEFAVVADYDTLNPLN
jgi:hypothetical protein